MLKSRTCLAREANICGPHGSERAFSQGTRDQGLLSARSVMVFLGNVSYTVDWPQMSFFVCFSVRVVGFRPGRRSAARMAICHVTGDEGFYGGSTSRRPGAA